MWQHRAPLRVKEPVCAALGACRLWCVRRCAFDPGLCVVSSSCFLSRRRTASPAEVPPWTCLSGSLLYVTACGEALGLAGLVVKVKGPDRLSVLDAERWTWGSCPPHSHPRVDEAPSQRKNSLDLNSVLCSLVGQQLPCQVVGGPFPRRQQGSGAAEDVGTAGCGAGGEVRGQAQSRGAQGRVHSPGAWVHQPPRGGEGRGRRRRRGRRRSWGRRRRWRGEGLGTRALGRPRVAVRRPRKGHGRRNSASPQPLFPVEGFSVSRKRALH